MQTPILWACCCRMQSICRKLLRRISCFSVDRNVLCSWQPTFSSIRFQRHRGQSKCSVTMQQRQTEQHFRKMMHGRQFVPLVDFPPCQSRKSRQSGKPICDCCDNFCRFAEHKKIRTSCGNCADCDVLVYCLEERCCFPSTIFFCRTELKIQPKNDLQSIQKESFSAYSPS